MKISLYTHILLSALVFTACSHYDSASTYTVGDADNAIVLSAGIAEGASGVSSRAGVEENHDKHTLFTSGTKALIRIDGEWHHKSAATTPISKTTTATIGGAAGTSGNDNQHNCISAYSPQLYWDDYGTADPDNAGEGKGRKKGLTIYAAAVDGEATAPTVSDWTALPWDLGGSSGSLDQTSGWSDKDLLISNNVKEGTGDGTFKFETDPRTKLLEFKHAMSKITINLKANKGFPTTGSNLVGNTPNKFEKNPAVTLLTRNADKKEIAYAITKGTVNITDGSVTPSTFDSDKKKIATKLDQIHGAWTDGGSEFKYTVQMTAIVCPGTVLGADPNNGIGDNKSAAEQMTLMKIEADGNIYYVNALQMSKKLNTDYKTEPGKNYIFNIIVDKTEVHVAATVAEWIDVVAEKDIPKIDITTSFGESGTEYNKGDFSLYYNDELDYTAQASGETSDHYYGTAPVDNKYGEERYFKFPEKKLYEGENATELFWPNHTIKYFFRGVWPRTNTGTPAVVKFEDNGTPHQGIAVSNTKYEKNKFPSDLMLGMPLNSDGTVSTEGISATEGTVTLNFRYRMAQVEVRLCSSGSADNVDFGTTGKAELAKVKILNGHTVGYIGIAKGESFFTTAEEYTMTPKSESLPTSIDYTTINDAFWTTYPTLVRHDAIIPQNLTNGSKPLQFEITTGSSDLTYDKYVIDINKIKVTSIDGVATTSANEYITEWEPGKHYIYTLKITKTKVSISATITDWIPVVAGGDFWL